MGWDLFWTYAGTASGFPASTAIVALGRKVGERVYWKCHPRPRLLGIDQRALTDRAAPSPPPNGGVRLRCMRHRASPNARIRCAEQIPGRSLAQFPTPPNHAAIGLKIDRFLPRGRH